MMPRGRRASYLCMFPYVWRKSGGGFFFPLLLFPFVRSTFVRLCFQGGYKVGWGEEEAIVRAYQSPFLRGEEVQKKRKGCRFFLYQKDGFGHKKDVSEGGGRPSHSLHTSIPQTLREGGEIVFISPPAQTNRMAKARRPTLPPPPLVHT